MSNKEYRPDEAFTLELIGIDEAPLFNDDGSPMTMSVLGEDSDVAVAARAATGNRRLQQGARGKAPTQEGIEADAANYLAKLVVDWNITPSKLIPGIDPGLGDGKVAYSPAAAISLFKHPKLKVIRDQPDRAIADRGNFLKASPTN